ncbi:MAG: DUF3179 domain-containing (seleno)protein [Thaumarchaeota archaeon]|nr:DUF3179 domain-containing (seleno)protein [Nitrososphaerota archaeon]
MKSSTKKTAALVIAVVIIGLSILAIENPFGTSVVGGDQIDSSIPVGTAKGQRAPNFSLDTLDDNKVTLAELRGLPVVVNFWATWCPFCIAELPDLEASSIEFKGKATFITINRAESIDKQRTFLNDLGDEFTFVFALDPRDDVAEAYGVRVMPTTFILDSNGVIVVKKLGQISRQELTDGIAIASGTKPSSSSERTDVLLTGERPSIDIYDLASVLEASNGDVIGVRGERLQTSSKGGTPTKHIIPLGDILSGGPPPDGIPSIDDPKFITATEASSWLADDEFVLGVEYNGVTRAYPHLILVAHEIVNDDFNGKPLLVTYCPLCFTGVAYVPTIDGEGVEFGTSGKLYKSNLVMYDRKTNSYWSQVTGQAIVGELTGLALRQIPIDTIRWGDWKSLHPDTQVLSKDTGYSRSYGRDPYGGYYVGSGPFFPVGDIDPRRGVMEIVYGILVDGKSKAYPVSEVVAAGGLVNDVFNGVSFLIFQAGEHEKNGGGGSSNVFSPALRFYDRNLSGQLLDFELRNGEIFDIQTNSKWSIDGVAIEGSLMGEKLERLVSGPEFWFVRSSFFPDTEIYTNTN